MCPRVDTTSEYFLALFQKRNKVTTNLLVKTIILTLAGCGMKGPSKEEGMEIVLPNVYSISSECISHEHTYVGLTWTELKQFSFG